MKTLSKAMGGSHPIKEVASGIHKLLGLGLKVKKIPLMVTCIRMLPAIILAALGIGDFGINVVCDL